MNLAQFILAKDFICHTSSDEAMRHSVISRSVSMCACVCVCVSGGNSVCVCVTQTVLEIHLIYSWPCLNDYLFLFYYGNTFLILSPWMYTFSWLLKHIIWFQGLNNTGWLLLSLLPKVRCDHVSYWMCLSFYRMFLNCQILNCNVLARPKMCFMWPTKWIKNTCEEWGHWKRNYTRSQRNIECWMGTPKVFIHGRKKQIRAEKKIPSWAPTLIAALAPPDYAELF